MSCSGFGSARSNISSSQRATRDLGDINPVPASIAEAAQEVLVDSRGFGHGAGSGGARSSADYKMLIAKADAMLGQFAAESSGQRS